MSTKNGNPKDAVGSTRVPMWLLSTTAKIAWATAQFAGMLKYGAWNWRADGIRLSVYLSAIERHVEGIKNGEDFDPVDGTRHEGNIMACAAIILDAKTAGNLVDDRPPRLDHRPALAEAEETMRALVARYAKENPKHWTIKDPLPGAPQDATIEPCPPEPTKPTVAGRKSKSRAKRMPAPSKASTRASRRKGRS
jgi:Domain of unknown function (DUF5664)